MAEKLGILASGRGSNFRAILEHIELGVLKDVEAGILISDNQDAQALGIADRYGVPHQFLSAEEEGNAKFEREVHEIFEERGVDLIILAGFMRILGPYLIERYGGRIMNIHPSLLPSFKGLNAQKKALDYGAKIAGCTVHYASKDVDSGPIILQHPVPVREDDTEEILSERILIFEHRIYSKAIQLHVDGRLEIEGGRVKIDYGGGWEEDWSERQGAFINHQGEAWKESKVFEEIWE